MKRLDEVFDLFNGESSSKFEVMEEAAPSRVRFVRPSQRQTNSVAGWIDRSLAKKVYPAGTLHISTDGEGSHTYTWVSPYEFVPNSNVVAAVPKTSMTLGEKLWWATIITANRPRYDYARKPKGERLSSLMVPDSAPRRFIELNVPHVITEYQQALRVAESTLSDKKRMLTAGVGTTKSTLDEYFDLRYGHSLEKVYCEEVAAPSGVNFVSRAGTNNGVSGRVIAPSGVTLGEKGELTVALGGTVLATFVQQEPFVCGRDVMILTPKRDMDFPEKLWWCAVIRANAFRYGYGRQANRTLAKLPVPGTTPAWVKNVNVSTETENYRDKLRKANQVLERAAPGDSIM